MPAKKRKKSKRVASALPPRPQPEPVELLNHTRGRLVFPDGQQMLPGANRVTPATVKRCREWDITRIWLERGLISVRAPIRAGSVLHDLKHGPPRSLVGLEPATITQAVQECCSKDQLFEWLEGAAEPAVREQINERAYQLTADDQAAPAEPGG